MKLRAETTTSERQLAMALAATGRTVSLDELTAWRKDGLLPPLANTGLGTGKGKSYYWRENNILEQAQMACDAMRSHGRKDQALVVLFLSGFSVPLVQLRRAWLHQARLRKPPAVQMAHEKPDVFALLDTGTDALLLQTVLCAGAALQSSDATEPSTVELILARAMAKMGLAQHGVNDTGRTGQLGHLLLIIGAVLDQSNLIGEAADQELLEAQRYLTTAATLLSDCGDVTGLMAGAAGPLLFILLLTLLHSGQAKLLHRAIAFLGGADLPVFYRPAGSLSLPA